MTESLADSQTWKMLIYYKKNKIQLLLSGGNSKKQAWGKKNQKNHQKTNTQNKNKSQNMIIQGDESYH